jgi:hypothetical protein
LRVILSKNAWKEIEELKYKYKLLETHLKYMPGGEGYLEAKEELDDDG